MKYDVYLDSLIIYGVADVTENSAREVKIHNGLGQGNFTTPGDRELKNFELTCELAEENERKLSGWQPAKELFSIFEKLLSSKSSQRLVIVSEHKNISVPVLLESYTKTEKYSGVYDVRLKFIEYKEVSAKTADVPYIKRPGKIPEPPPTVVFKKSSDAAKDAAARSPGKSIADYKYLDYYYKDKNGNLVSVGNPNLVPKNTTVTVTSKEVGPAYTQYSGTTGVGADYDYMSDVRNARGKLSSQQKKTKIDDTLKAMEKGIGDFFKFLSGL